MTEPKPDGYDPGRIGGTPDEIAEVVGAQAEAVSDLLDDSRARQAEITAAAEASRVTREARTPDEVAAASEAGGKVVGDLIAFYRIVGGGEPLGPPPGPSECDPNTDAHADVRPNSKPTRDPTDYTTLVPGVVITYVEDGNGPSIRFGDPEQLVTHTATVNGLPEHHGDDWWIPVDVSERRKTVYVCGHNIVGAIRP